MLYKKENKMILEKEYLFKKNILGIFSLYISITMSLCFIYHSIRIFEKIATIYPVIQQ